MTAKEILDCAKQLKALADVGLLYSADEYNKERYLEILDLSKKLFAGLSDNPDQEIEPIFLPVNEYPTAKVDIRGVLLSEDNKVLLVRESADGKWALPGGWADIGNSPEETIVKEFKEETGLDVSVENLLAVFDKRLHPHPPQAFYVYKMVFHCKALSTAIMKGFDVLDAAFFDLKSLPELSEDRILESQIQLVCKKILTEDFRAYFD